MTKKPSKSVKITKAAKPAKAAKAKSSSPPAARPNGEQMLRDVEKALGKQNFSNIGDVNAFLANLMGAGGPLFEDDGPLSAKEQAQDIAYDAMEAESAAKARKLAKQALTKDPDCVDALVLLVNLDARTPKEAIEALQKAVAAGERSLGAKFFKENKGYFWGLIETRPYMRALESLARLLRADERNPDAIHIYEKILALNPNDNQGVRDPLLGLYLATNNLEATRKLLEDYKDDDMANFAWGRVLERFLSADLPGAAAALKTARKANHFVELYLSGQKELPKSLPDMYSSGSEEEAALFLDNMLLAWTKHEKAIFWLLEQLVKEMAAKKKPAAKLKLVPRKARKLTGKKA
jgi:tetratricopeptide (TPR) repeat protein